MTKKWTVRERGKRRKYKRKEKRIKIGKKIERKTKAGDDTPDPYTCQGIKGVKREDNVKRKKIEGKKQTKIGKNRQKMRKREKKTRKSRSGETTHLSLPPGEGKREKKGKKI